MCNSCEYFHQKRHQRYLILHTLEHAIITAMPKYTSINKNQVRGTIYPNLRAAVRFSACRYN